MEPPRVQLASLKRVVALECCACLATALGALALLGPTTVAFGLIAVCALTMVPALVAVDQLEKRRAR